MKTTILFIISLLVTTHLAAQAQPKLNRKAMSDWQVRNKLMGSVGAYQIFGLSLRYERFVLSSKRNSKHFRMSVGGSTGSGFAGVLHVAPHVTALISSVAQRHDFKHFEFGIGMPVLVHLQEPNAGFYRTMAGISFPVGLRLQHPEGGYIWRFGLAPTIFPKLFRGEADFAEQFSDVFYLFTPHLSLGFDLWRA